MSSVPSIVVVVLFLLELLSQTKAVLHLVFGILVQGARSIKDLLVLLIVVTLCARLIDVGNNVVWSAVAILTRFESIWPIMSAVGCCAVGRRGGEVPKDGGDHLVMILEGIVIAPRWSVAPGAIVVVIV